MTQAWREAIDAVEKRGERVPRSSSEKLASLAEGRQTTIGAYERSWQ